MLDRQTNGMYVSFARQSSGWKARPTRRRKDEKADLRGKGHHALTFDCLRPSPYCRLATNNGPLTTDNEQLTTD